SSARPEVASSGSGRGALASAAAVDRSRAGVHARHATGRAGRAEHAEHRRWAQGPRCADDVLRGDARSAPRRWKAARAGAPSVPARTAPGPGDLQGTATACARSGLSAGLVAEVTSHGKVDV